VTRFEEVTGWVNAEQCGGHCIWVCYAQEQEASCGNLAFALCLEGRFAVYLESGRFDMEGRLSPPPSLPSFSRSGRFESGWTV
jgi:hypothetical protein